MATNHPNHRSSGLPTGQTADITHEILADGLLLRIEPGRWTIFAPGTSIDVLETCVGGATYILAGRGQPTQADHKRARKIWLDCTSTAAILSAALGITASGPVLWIGPDYSVIYGWKDAAGDAEPYQWSFHPPGSTAEAIACGEARSISHGRSLPTRSHYDRAVASWHVIARTRELDKSGVVPVHRPENPPRDRYLHVRWCDNRPFVQGYIAGMFPERSRLHWANPTFNNPLRGYRNIAGDILDEITADCERFLAACGPSNDGDTEGGGRAFWKERQRGLWRDAGFPPVDVYVDDKGKVRLREIEPPGESRFETSTVSFGEDKLVLSLRPRGWTIHPPGTSDEAIAAGKAPCILGGRGRPTDADHERVGEVWRERALTAHFDTRDVCLFYRSFFDAMRRIGPIYHWRKLKPFVRGYIAAMFGHGLGWDDTERGANWPRAFRNIRRTLDEITADCERFLAKPLDPDARNTLQCGVEFWNQRSRGMWRDSGFPPVAPYVDNTGYVRLRTNCDVRPRAGQ